MLRIRAFKAIDDTDAGEKFAIGHKKVLEDIGVKVTSGNNDWVEDPNVFVMIVEDTAKDNEVLGGVRLHVANKITVLPMVEAISKVEDKIYGEINNLMDAGTAEICGIWNSRKVMGLGLGAIYLMRCSIALSTQVGLSTMLSFASRATRGRGYEKGFEPFTVVGNKGEFNYPKLDLIATAVICYDPEILSLATEKERNEIFKLRNKQNFIATETWPKGEFELEYNIKLP
tara:strand:+ start:44228 stop:44914 length:687 start_codon:yes stop_codon:yes gene_type:complete